MIIVVNDKVVQEQMVKEAEQEEGISFTIPWSVALSILVSALWFFTAVWYIVHAKSIAIGEKHEQASKQEANQEAD